MSGGNGHGRFVDGKIWSENRKVVENAMMNCLSLVDRSTACQKLQKVPLPTLGRLAAPLGSLHPLPPSKPPICWRRPRSLYCDGSVAELFVLRGQPWLDAIPFGCWCHYWGVASFQLLEEDIVLFPRPRLSPRVPAHGLPATIRLQCTFVSSSEKLLLLLLQITGRSLAPVHCIL